MVDPSGKVTVPLPLPPPLLLVVVPVAPYLQAAFAFLACSFISSSALPFSKVAVEKGYSLSQNVESPL